MNRRATAYFATVTILVTLVLGCRQDSSQATIGGNVTLDGQPIKQGVIRFVPADGGSATADAPIRDGVYTAAAPVGEKRVEITAPKVVGSRKMYEGPGTPAIDVVEEMLPARYNVQSTLTLTAVPGDQSKDFELQSGK
jgi:hypothetical protein